MARALVDLQERRRPESGIAPAHKESREPAMRLVSSQEFFDGQETRGPKSNSAPLPVWNGAEYKRILPGRYSAVAVRVQGPEWVRQYSRWSLLVEFELLGESGAVRVCAFFNMGNDKKEPKAGRQSRFFRAWTIANGELPRKGHEMDLKVFLDGQVWAKLRWTTVAGTQTKNSSQRVKSIRRSQRSSLRIGRNAQSRNLQS